MGRHRPTRGRTGAYDCQYPAERMKPALLGETCQSQSSGVNLG